MFSDRSRVPLGKVPINACIIKGDLTTEKVDVIVCAASKNLDLSKGRASRAVLEAAGNAMQQECNAQWPMGIDFSQVAMVNAGNLSCKKVCFIALPVWGVGYPEEQGLDNVITECMKLASKANYQSLSIPALGTGLLKYPTSVVAKTTLDAVENFSNNNPGTSLRYVNIVIFYKDEEAFIAFEQEASNRASVGASGPVTSPAGGASGARPKVVKGSIGSRLGNKKKPQQLGMNSIINSMKYKGRMKADCMGTTRVKVMLGQLPDFQADVIVNNTSTDLKLENGGLAEDLLKKAGHQLQNELDEMYPGGIKSGDIAVTGAYSLKCSRVYHGALPKWDHKSMNARKAMCRVVCKCLKSAEKDFYNSIAFPALGTGSLNYPANESAKIMFKCIARHVKEYPKSNISDINIVIYEKDKHAKDVKKIFQDELGKILEKMAGSDDEGEDEGPSDRMMKLLEHGITTSLERRLAPTRGTKDWFKFMFQSTPRSPSYWTMFNNIKTLKEWIMETHASVFEKNPVDQETFQAVESLVESTWQKDNVGKGRDAAGLDKLNYTHVKVTKVERIENCALFTAYANQRQQMFQKGIQKGVFEKCEGMKGSSGPIMTDKLLKDDSPLRRDLYPEINEYYMFHGTQADVVDKILVQGLDSRLSGTSAMFGQGVYMAESSTKSDQYADNKDQRTSKDRKMFLVRTCLGEMCLFDRAKALARPPCMICLMDKCRCPNNEMYDSVVGDGTWIFREFVVYDRTMVYPEYIITYERK